MPIFTGTHGNDTIHVSACDTAFGGSGADRFVVRNTTNHFGGGGVITIAGGQFGHDDDTLDVSDLIANGWSILSNHSVSDLQHLWLVPGEEGRNGTMILTRAGSLPITIHYTDIEKFVTTAPAGAANGVVNGSDAGQYMAVGFSDSQGDRVTEGNDTVFGNGGHDDIRAGNGDDSIFGGNDTMNGDAGHDTLRGEDGNDFLDGGLGNDYLTGDAGQDSILGGEGNDTINNGSGRDTVYGGHGNDFLDDVGGTATADADLVYGDAGNDTIYGSSSHDTLFGGSEHDYINGEVGNDLINGGTGADTLHGAEGNDTFFVASAAEGAGDCVVGGNGPDHNTDLDVLDLRGAGQVTINARADSSDAGARTGTVTFANGAVLNFSQIETILQDGNGLVNGTDAGQHMGVGFTDADGDRVTDGNDTVFGNGGADEILAGNGNDSVFGGNDNDTVQGGLGNDVINGDAGDDSLLGNEGIDHINGGAGQDVLFGGDSNDTLVNGAGRDTVYGGDGNDFIDEEGGYDSTRDADLLFGDAGNDTMFGSAVNDTVFGGADQDYINGESGDDQITGGTGADTMRGDGGNDTFYVGSAEEGAGDSITAGNGPDQNTDLDVLDLRGAGAVTINARADASDAGARTGTVTFANGAVLNFSQIETILTDPQAVAPTANNDAAATAEDTAVVINVLANDTDPNGDTLRVVSATAANGTVTINANGTIAYTPDANFSGEDSISYTITDPAGNTATGEVTVDVAPVNDGPVAADLATATNEDVSAIVNVLSSATDADGDALSVTSATAQNGTVTINADGTLNYTPNQNFNGDDTITYTVTDAAGNSDQGTVDVTVAPVDDLPVANDDTAATDEDVSITINVLSNDGDADGTPLQVTEATAANGSVTINDDGTLSYTPNPDFNGDDTINYTVSDAEGNTAQASVALTVAPVDDGPSGDGVVDGEAGAEYMAPGYDDAGGRTNGGGDQITDGDDVIDGNGGNDTIDSGAGDDVVNGGTGDDVFIGGLGDDTLAGGDGQDDYVGTGAGHVSIYVDNMGDGTVSELAAGAQWFDAPTGVDTVTSVEHFSATENPAELDKISFTDKVQASQAASQVQGLSDDAIGFHSSELGNTNFGPGEQYQLSDILNGVSPGAGLPAIGPEGRFFIYSGEEDGQVGNVSFDGFEEIFFEVVSDDSYAGMMRSAAYEEDLPPAPEDADETDPADLNWI